MAKKRRRHEEEADDQATEAPVNETTVPQEAAADTDEPAPGGLYNKRSKSLVNPETSTYLDEVVTHFKTLVDDEERSLLVGNVLEEIAGKEVKVAGDPVCSRHVETLMAAAQASQLLKFLTSVSDVDGFFTLVSSPFGSHVVEKLLVRVEAQLDVMSQDEYDEFERVMTMLTDSICPHLYDYVTDRYATHVVRRLLCLLAGRNVLPPPGKQQQQQLPGLENKRSKNEPLTGLAAKLGGTGGQASAGCSNSAAAMAAELLGLGAGGDSGDGGGPPSRLPDLVVRFVGVLCGDDYTGPTASELVYHPYACPFLQALLRAAASDRKALRQLVPVLLGATTVDDSARGGAGAVLAGCREEEVAAMTTDPTTSHLLEVIMQVLPKPLFEEFFRRFLAPRLADLAHHPSANYVVQAALAAAPSKEVAKTMYDSLASLLPDLLRKRRSGVVAALVACCGRWSVCQREACTALAAALQGLPQWASLTGDGVLAPALLCLDSIPAVGSNEPFTAATVAASRGGGGMLPRLSPVGCSILIQVLRYGQGACRAFTDSVVALQPNDAARVGADPSGSRVLEALLDGNAPAKVKGALLAALAERWDAVASTASGSFLVETAYRWADLPAKEAVVSRLAGATKALEVTHWGPALLRKVGAEAYTRDPDQWRRHAASASKTLDQFAKIFGGSDGGGGGAEGKGAKGKGRKDTGAGAGTDGNKKKKGEKTKDKGWYKDGGEGEGDGGGEASGRSIEEVGQGGGRTRKKVKEEKKRMVVGGMEGDAGDGEAAAAGSGAAGSGAAGSGAGESDGGEVGAGDGGAVRETRKGRKRKGQQQGKEVEGAGPSRKERPEEAAEGKGDGLGISAEKADKVKVKVEKREGKGEAGGGMQGAGQRKSKKNKKRRGKDEG